jgi:phenylpyruvate tautomerase PptA (4-oxalocrotonate tautomerase family)
MPLVRFTVPKQMSSEQVKHVSDSIHESLVATFNVPHDDRFQVASRQAPDELICAPSYLGISHTDRVVFIQITCNEGRTLEMKRALFAAVARSISEGGAVLAADVIVNLVEVKKENWSFGNGAAQYAS